MRGCPKVNQTFWKLYLYHAARLSSKLMIWPSNLQINMNETSGQSYSFFRRSLLQPEMDVKWVISEEERTRHDALFYSQKPQDRYLSGKRWNILTCLKIFNMAVCTQLCKYFEYSRRTSSFFIYTIQIAFTGAQQNMVCISLFCLKS